jgi:hypothetical protein
MKKLLLAGLLLFAISCDKEGNPINPAKVCCDCTEANTGYVDLDAYCGTNKEVDLFITELKQQGAQAGQSWTCTKH